MCDPKCNECSNSSTNCTKCNSGFKVLSNGSCASNICQYGYFLNGSNCSNCSTGCKSCSKFDNCFECFPPYILGNFGTQCSPCNTSFFYRSTTRDCSNCPKNCTECVSPSQCLICADSYNALLNINQGLECFLTCPDGYYAEASECHRTEFFKK